MKKILIIEDNQVVANVYRNKLAAEGYQAEIALDGERGVERLRVFQPDLILLDLMLPAMSGVDFIKQVRGEKEFARLPIVVFSNAHLTNLIQDAWKAGANKCLAKATASPRDVVDVVRQLLGDRPATLPPPDETTFVRKPARVGSQFKPDMQDAEVQAGLQQEFGENLQSTLAALRAGLQQLVKTKDEVEQLKQIFELYRRLHALTDYAGIAGLNLVARMSDAVEALFKELYENPKHITPSTLRTAAAGVDILGFLVERGADNQEVPTADILVVDDEPISRRAINYAIEKARMRAANAEDATTALQLLTERNFDLIFLDVEMPDLNGYELCAKLRAMPQYQKTPVIFVTAWSDFDNRASSLMAGGNDFIAKPFLFIELTVKTLIHVFRAKLSAQKRIAPAAVASSGARGKAK